MTVLTASTFPAEVLHSEVPVIVDFGAPWCPPCKVLEPLLDALAPEYAGRVKVVKVDADLEPDLAARYRVMNLPTMLVFKKGALVDKIVGFRGPAPVRALFQGLAEGG